MVGGEKRYKRLWQNTLEVVFASNRKLIDDIYMIGHIRYFRKIWELNF